MSDTSKDRTRVVIRALNHGHTLPCARRDCLVCFAIQHIEAQAAWMEGAKTDLEGLNAENESLRAAIAELEAFNAKEFALIREMDADLARYKAAVEAVLAIVGPRDIVRKAIDKALGEQKP